MDPSMQDAGTDQPPEQASPQPAAPPATRPADPPPDVPPLPSPIPPAIAPPEDLKLTALERRIAALEELVGDAVKALTQTLKQLAERIDDSQDLTHRTEAFPALFVAERTNSDGRWKEMTDVNGSIVPLGTPGTDGRNCTSNSHASLPIGMSQSQYALLEILDGTDHRYVILPNGDFDVYVTEDGTGTNGTDGTGGGSPAFPDFKYNVFTDAAKTIQIGTALSPRWHRELQIAVVAGTHGRARLEGSTVVLLQVDEYFDRDGCP